MSDKKSKPPVVETVDDVLWRYLGDEILRAMLLPPRMPTFALSTKRPPRGES